MGLKREQLIAANSMILHELYFANLGEGDGRRVRWLERSNATSAASSAGAPNSRRWGKALGGGSGWVVLVHSHRDGRLMNQWAADHAHALAHSTPILALDMYEHSYHIDYGRRRALTSMPSCGTSAGATWRRVTRRAPAK